jgi:hypothetical protein
MKIKARQLKYSTSIYYLTLTGVREKKMALVVPIIYDGLFGRHTAQWIHRSSEVAVISLIFEVYTHEREPQWDWNYIQLHPIVTDN